MTTPGVGCERICLLVVSPVPFAVVEQADAMVRSGQVGKCVLKTIATLVLLYTCICIGHRDKCSQLYNIVAYHLNVILFQCFNLANL